MKESLTDQRKKRIGPNDVRRNRRAKRQTDVVTFLLLVFVILFVFTSTVGV